MINGPVTVERVVQSAAGGRRHRMDSTCYLCTVSNVSRMGFDSRDHDSNRMDDADTVVSDRALETPVRKLENDAVRIVRFRDGDTVEITRDCCRCKQMSKAVVRIVDIESWEYNSQYRSWALRVAAAATSKWRDHSGFLVWSPSRYDKYGRLVGDILLEGELLSTALVKSNLAWAGVGKAPPPDFLKTFSETWL